MAGINQITIKSGRPNLSDANTGIKRISGKWRIQEVKSGHGPIPVKHESNMGGQKPKKPPPHQLSSLNKLQLTLISILDGKQ